MLVLLASALFAILITADAANTYDYKLTVGKVDCNAAAESIDACLRDTTSLYHAVLVCLTSLSLVFAQAPSISLLMHTKRPVRSFAISHR
jgi:hypothetical protein